MRTKMTYKEKLGLEKAAASLVSERHAAISSLEFRMTYYQRGLGAVLMKRTLCFSPGDHATFHLRCMEDGCTGGGFDMAPVVARLVKSRKRSTNGKLFCHGTNHAVGHASIEYEVNIQYNRQVK